MVVLVWEEVGVAVDTQETAVRTKAITAILTILFLLLIGKQHRGRSLALEKEASLFHNETKAPDYTSLVVIFINYLSTEQQTERTVLTCQPKSLGGVQLLLPQHKNQMETCPYTLSS